MQGEGEREGHNTMRLLRAIPAATVALAIDAFSVANLRSASDFSRIN
jgi:hypothetical protein